MQRSKGDRSPLMFTDSSDSDNQEQTPKKITKAKGPISSKLSKSYNRPASASSSSMLLDSRSFDLGSSSTKNAISKSGSPANLFTAPAPKPQQRKRAHASSASASLRTVRSPYQDDKKGSFLDESLSSDFFSDADDEYSMQSSSKVSQILGKLGSELQQKLRAKKQRIEEQFKAIKALPPILLNTRQHHAEQRQKLLETLQVESGKIEERLENMIHLADVQYEKHQKSLESISKGSEEIRMAIEKCVATQAAMYVKFTEDMKKYDQRHSEGMNTLTQRCEATLRKLHSHLEDDMVQTELDNLAKIKS